MDILQHHSHCSHRMMALPVLLLFLGAAFCAAFPLADEQSRTISKFLLHVARNDFGGGDGILRPTETTSYLPPPLVLISNRRQTHGLSILASITLEGLNATIKQRGRVIENPRANCRSNPTEQYIPPPLLHGIVKRHVAYLVTTRRRIFRA